MGRQEKTVAVAIDGPAGAGKSTIARRVAATLGYIYVDTGALYRSVGWYALEQGVMPSDAQGVATLLPKLKVDLVFVKGEQRVLVQGEDVSDRIRTPEVSMAASAVSAIPAVREFLFHLQQDMAVTNNVVMDGRDIGTVVLPHAKVKIFLTASPQERARRRYQELVQKGEPVTYEAVLADLEQRDEQDSNRAVAPLKPAKDSILIDTTGLSLEESVRRLTDTVRTKLNRGKDPYQMSGMYRFFTKIGPALMQLLFRVRIEGTDKLPKEGGCILACNHISNLDPIFLAIAVIPRQVRFMAKEELFHSRIGNWFFQKLGAFPVRRGKGDAGALQVGEDLVNHGCIMGIFPEGTRSKDLKPMRAKAGIAVIASKSGSDVYPAAIITKKGVKLFRRVRVVIGDPITKEQMTMDSDSSREMKRVAGLIMEHITELWEQGHEQE